MASKFNEEGNIVQVSEGNGGTKFDSTSEVEEHNGILWIGSAIKPYVGSIILICECKKLKAFI